MRDSVFGTALTRLLRAIPESALRPGPRFLPLSAQKKRRNTLKRKKRGKKAVNAP